ncbi:MAG: capsular polysaccharide biosynthesis protein [Silicimonas sp.]|nr:capsular polysaccharide biosynthesis protein [Silicimonas sp.]
MSDRVTQDTERKRLCVYTGGFLNGGRLNRLLNLSGWDVELGVPGEDDWVGIWGRTPRAWRGEAVAEWADAPILTVEDAFLRSVHPGRVKSEDPIGICIDKTGVHFDGSAPSDLETLLATHPLDDTQLLDRARHAIDSIKHWHLGKYCATEPAIDPPAPGYVVVIDQTRGDAALMGAARADFLEMLTFAAEENPASDILIKTHPETLSGTRNGHFDSSDAFDRVHLITDPISPWRLFEGAVGVYTHSSTLGFEAIFAGHQPRVFGQPFYAGWGLTRDGNAPARRERVLTRAQLFAAAMILYPVWYDPTSDTLCEIEQVIAHLAARARAWREDRHGYVAIGMKPWKRPHLARMLGREVPVKFARKVPATNDRKAVVWGMSEAPEGVLRMEDGFLRSRGLGAELVPPLSFVLDQPSLYVDPSSPGKLDALIAKTPELPLAEIRRAEALMARINRLGLTKYNLSAPAPDLPDADRTILVAGQVEDDASILFGASDTRTNLELLQKTRAANPRARILWKPHPDVEAGLRKGHVDESDLEGLADLALLNIGASEALKLADEVWTISSTLGFEALLRKIPVTCLGMPFYAGRGLTTDLVDRPDHRKNDATLPGLVHACLIGYPRYADPRDGAPLSPEEAVTLLSEGFEMPRRNALLARLQRLLPRP